MKIASEKIVPIDFDAEELPIEIRELRPVVFYIRDSLNVSNRDVW